jgi:putative zinc finger/helix-turn-helix YgiT family protein
MHDDDETSSNPIPGKPFPWLCQECGQKAVWRITMPYATEVLHDDQLQRVDVPELRAPRCEACGEMIFDIEAGTQVSQALRELLGLLTPAEIRDHRNRLGISTHGLAEHLGISSETISFWEEGLRIQTRAMDRYLRVYFQSAEGRAAVVSFAAVPPPA